MFGERTQVCQIIAMDFEVSIEKRLQQFREAKRERSLAVPSENSFIHNDYLGLSKHPQIVEAGIRAIRDWGAGSRGSRLLGGHSKIYESVEEKIANFFGAPAALFFSSGYLANLAAVRGLASLVKQIYSDELCHASLIDGIRLSGLPKTILPHNQWDPEAVLTVPTLFVSESLFSMDGDVVNLKALQGLASKSGGMVLLDEAHAGGVFPQSGRGLGEASQKAYESLVRTVTFGKAFGVGGAAILCSERFRQLLVNEAKSFIYTTAAPPAVPAMVEASLSLVAEGQTRRQRLWQRAQKVRQRLLKKTLYKQGLGGVFKAQSYWEQFSPIIAFHIPGVRNVLPFSKNMRECGFEVRPIRYPTVALGKERLRISLSLAVDEETTERMTEALVNLWTAYLLREQTQG